MRFVPILLLVACPDPETAPVDTGAADVQESDDAPLSPIDDEESESEDSGPEPEPEPEHIVRFIAMGDGGEGNTRQFAVADVVEQVCAMQGCDFALYLGDNFYDEGVDGVDDPQFESKFELPYQNLGFPFYVVLGNHDFGEIPVQFWRTDYQIDYTAHSTKWTMPDHFYTHTHEHVDFFSLDTNMIMLGLEWVENQDDWIDNQLAASTGMWRIAYGHHPYLSNGPHGNAGNYEGLGFLDFLALANGEYIQDFVEDHLCGQIDLYLAGHDHSRQWLEVPNHCDTEFIVTGAAAKMSDLEHRDDNDTIWEDVSRGGFTWIEIADNVMTVEFWNEDGVMEYQGIRTK